MNEFWGRRKRAKRAERLVGISLTIGLTLCLLTIYALLRTAVVTWVLERPAPLSLEESAAALILALSSTWVFVRTLERNATSLMVFGLGARALKQDCPDEAGLQDLVDKLTTDLGVIRLEVLVCDLSAVNFFALRTFEGRNLVFVTEGALMRLDARLLKAGLAQCMARLCLPEARAWSAYSFIYGSLHQVRLGPNKLRKKTHLSAITGFRFMGRLVYFLGSPWRLAFDPSVSLAADEEAALITRDPIAFGEAVSRLQVQWRGAGMVSPALSFAAFSDINWTRWTANEPALEKERRSEQMSPISRIKNSLSAMQYGLAPLFKVARSKRSPGEKQNSSDEITYRVVHKGRVEGPHGTTAIQGFTWMNARSVVQLEDGGAPGLAFEFNPLRRLFFGRFQPCPRCGVTLTPFIHQQVEMRRCMKCNGVFAKTAQLPSLGAEREKSDSERRFANRMKRFQKEANLFAQREAGEGTRVFPESKCPDCRKPMTFQTLPFKRLPVVLTCGPCGSAWFDAEELPALLSKLERLVSWKRVVSGDSDALLPHPDIVLFSIEDKARAAGVNVSNRSFSDFMKGGVGSAQPPRASAGSTSGQGTGEEAVLGDDSSPPAEEKRGLIRGAFVPRDAEEVRRERSLKARRERIQTSVKRKQESRRRRPVDPEAEEPKE